MATLPFCRMRLRAEKPKSTAYPRELNTLGNHLRKRRPDLGLLQRDVAAAIGVGSQDALQLGKATNRAEDLPARCLSFSRR